MREWIGPILSGTGPYLSFLGLAVVGGMVLAVAGRLAHDADVIAQETKLGGLWIGSLLLAAATSLPELLTDINAALLDVPDIGAGDLLGSSMANMAILAVANLLFLHKRMFAHADTRHVLVALLGIILTSIVGFGIAVRGLSLGPVGLDSALIVAVYVGGMWLLRGITRAPAGAETEAPTEQKRLWRAYAGFGIAALVLVILAPALVVTAEIFAEESGLSNGFVGTLILGAMTSFPELSATLMAVRLGSYDLAVGGILGSNAFNMTYFFVMDLFYSKGPVTRAVSLDHLPTVFFAAIMMALGAISILYRQRERPGAARMESLLILAIYLGGMAFLAARQGPGP